MVINDLTFNADCSTIVTELAQQLAINKIPLLQTIQDSSEDIMIACPYHKDGQEKRPSMGIRKSDGMCHCFACNTVVTLPQLISHCFGEESEIGAFGWNWLLKNFLTVSVEERKDIDLDFSREHSKKEEQTYVSEEELDGYRWTHPYWAKRKITDEHIIELFDLGYDKETDCITMPVRDVSGKCLFVARRSVKTKFFNYPAGAEKPLYGLYELYKTARKDFDLIGKPFIYDFPDELIVCESMIDALTAWQFGKPAVALNGLGTQLQFKQLSEMPCRKLILATDADGPGMQARERIRKNVKNKIISEYVWDLSVAKDINDMSKEYFDSLEEIL